ncbi:MAG TPA: RecT family recombinase [Bradyrhizobium sp.]|nr:RecT family recombinase [Bradyrhizobium sp.]
MSDQRNAVTTTDKPNFDQLSRMPVERAVDVYMPDIINSLPPDVSPEHFRSVVMTAINMNPDLVSADRRTLLMSCIKCASDGLVPDGREAALVIYKTKVKVPNGNGGTIERWVDAVQLMPMVYGIRKRMRNSGEVASADAHVVYRHDRFRYALGDNAFIEHEPAALDVDPGDIIGSYAIIKLNNGEVLRDVLRKSDIERARAQSKAKDGPMWRDHYGEAARKTALRRCAKSAPQSAAMQRLSTMLDRGEEIEMPDGSAVMPPPARPQRSEFTNDETAVTESSAALEQVFALIDLDGVEHEFGAVAEVQAKMLELIGDAEKRGIKALDGLMESNGEMFAFLRDAGNVDAWNAIMGAANAAVKRIEAAAARPTTTAGAAQPVTPPYSSGSASTASPGAAGNASGQPAAQDAPNRSEAAPAQPTLAIDNTQEPLPERSAWFDRPSLLIEPRSKNGRQDWAAWKDAQFLPRMRSATTTEDMAHLLGDNEANLGTCRNALGCAAELKAAIEAQWARIPA